MERGQRLRIHARVTALVVVAAQVVTGAALAGLLAAGGDSKAAYSVLTGTLAGVLPNYYLALKIFGPAADATPERYLRAIYAAEALKIAFAASLLAIAASFLDVSVPYVIGGYLVTVMVQWFALLLPSNGGT